MTDRLGRADLHIHTLASDGTSGIDEILLLSSWFRRFPEL